MKPGRVTRQAGERQRAEGVARRVSRRLERHLIRDAYTDEVIAEYDVEEQP